MKKLIQITKMQKIGVSGLLLLLLFISAEIRPLLPWVDYYVNFEYIKDVLCINKDDESIKCDGKCYLRTELKDKSLSDNSSKNQSKPLRIEWDKQIQFFEDLVFTYNLSFDLKKINFYFEEQRINSFNIKPPFPPPKIV